MNQMPRLLEIMAKLRDPQHGCPWDRKQSYATIAPHTLEEAFEVADAIEHGDIAGLREELGDLLFQIVFYAQIADEEGTFNFGDVVDACIDKMLRRHPHVFGDAEVADAQMQTEAWEAHKEQERKAKGDGETVGALDGIALALPALTRALKLQRRAARVGFDWEEWRPVLKKIYEELEELEQAIDAGDETDTHRAVEEELGDLIFTCVNLARHLSIDPEQALRRTNKKFEGRFGYLESALQEAGHRLSDVPLEEMDRLWESAKHKNY